MKSKEKIVVKMSKNLKYKNYATELLDVIKFTKQIELPINDGHLDSSEQIAICSLSEFMLNHKDFTDNDLRILIKKNPLKFGAYARFLNLMPDFVEELKNHGTSSIQQNLNSIIENIKMQKWFERHPRFVKKVYSRSIGAHYED